MMTKKQYSLKSCKSYVISPTLRSLTSPTLQTESLLPRPRRSIILLVFSCILMLCAIVAVSLSCSPRVTAAPPTTNQSEASLIQATLKASPWISPAVTLPTAFSIYVLPSLLDSLESVSVKTTSTSTSMKVKSQE